MSLKIYSKLTGEHPCRKAISINLLFKFIEIALRHGCSPVNLLYIFKNTFIKEHHRRAASVQRCFEKQVSKPGDAKIFQTFFHETFCDNTVKTFYSLIFILYTFTMSSFIILISISLDWPLYRNHSIGLRCK